MFWRRRKAREADLDREIRSHLDLEAQEHIENGCPADDARYAAKRALGNLTGIKEQVREVWNFAAVERFCQDLRYAIQQLLRSKGFSLTAILTLALGIGANTAIFTLIHAVMLKSLPVADPQTLVRFGDGYNCCVLGGYQGRFSVFSYPLYTYFRDHTPELEQLAAFQAGVSSVGVRRAGDKSVSLPLVDQFVSGNFFSMFGLHAFAGRLLSPADDLRSAAPVAVISYRAWVQDYGADPSLIGSTLVIEGAPYTLVGVAPPGFFGAMMRANPPELWMPLADEPAAHRQNSLLDANLLHRDDENWLYVIGRLRPGTGRKHLEAEINTELRQWFLANQPPRSQADKQELDRQYVAIIPGGSGIAEMKSSYEEDLRLLIGITALVLLIACANLANLQLARGAANVSQISVRVALGASRLRVMRQVLTESLVLAVLGGIAGLLLAFELATLLVRLAFPGARWVPIDATPSLPVLGFAFLLSLATGIVFGVAPAWSASRADPASALQGAGRTTGRITFSQKSLMVVQTALSLVLLCSAGLMTETLQNLERRQLGFETEHTAVVNVRAGFGDYAPSKIEAIYRDIENSMRRIPGVQNAALALYSPMSGNNWQSGVTLEEHPSRMVSPSWDRVSPNFFNTIGAQLLRGREFDDHDTPDSTHVTVVNEAFAKQYFPNEDPIGKRFGLGEISQSADYQIIGVINNVRFRHLRETTPQPMFFLPLLQMSKDEWENTGKARSNYIQCIILRVSGRPSGLASHVHRALAAIDPNLTMIDIRTMAQQIQGLLLHERLIARLAELFGVLALALASLGLYGITAYSVARRTTEIGVRAALGATHANVLRLVLKGALALIAIGLIIGIPAAIMAGRLLAGEVYGVKTSDPLILGAAALVLIVCATAASVIPAIHAAKVDPVIALKYE